MAIPVEHAVGTDATLNKRFAFSLTGRGIDHVNLEETFTYSPLDRLLPSKPASWALDWDEEQVYGTIIGHLVQQPHYRLSAELDAGASRGEFKATNQESGFSEWWQTEPAFLWGGGMITEVYRKQQDQGLFLRLVYGFRWAAADEHKEVVRAVEGTGGVGDTGTRAAFFSWEHQEGQILLGHRGPRFIPLAGISWSRLHLNKHLESNIVDSGIDPLLLAVINTEEAFFQYQNTSELSWLIALEMAVTERLEIMVNSRIDSGLHWQFAIRWAL